MTLVNGRDTTPHIITGWAVLVAAVGFALLFRSGQEQAVGVVYLTGASFLFASAHVIRHRILALLGFSIICLAFGSRAVSAFFLPIEWHGKVIVFCTWGGLSWIAYSRAQRVAGGH